ncbi:MAG: hypothetical protein A2W42_02450 [Candidatus Muproteobacteria bacterium RIFCSPHIGHO2_01_60_12]|nr:MAG: hypothetical protein A2W42_02450 [Candidatus Muproteobacteria bacterium RIFCSPHIGHO2_01_60_12]
MPNGILIIAVFSGFAALAYQVTWIRWFGLLFGNSAYAISAVLCAFFAGIAIGSAVFGFISRRVKRPLMLYALIEMTACGFALVVPYVIDLYDPLYESLYSGLMDSKGLFVSVKFALALAAMLPVTILLGGSLPLLATAFVEDSNNLGNQGNVLYSLNTLGAIAGVIAGSLVLPEVIGIRATYGVGLLAGTLAGLAAFFVSSRQKVQPDIAAHAAGFERMPRSLLAIAFASGAGVLAFEVLLIRGLGIFLHNSVYSFGAILLAVLTAITLGAAAISRLPPNIHARVRSPR